MGTAKLKSKTTRARKSATPKRARGRLAPGSKARGLDAADVAISTAFGPAHLVRFKVITEELKDAGQERLLKEAA